MKRFLKRLFWKTLVYVGLPSMIIAGAYGWWARSRLDQTLSADQVKSWSLGSCTFVNRAESKIDTSFSKVLRVSAKRKDGANFRPFGQKLVHAVYDWSPGRSQWVELPMSLEEQTESLKLRSLEIQTPGQHIEHLSDQNPNVREVASALLRLRTGQDFGYHPDRPPESQKDAIEKWRSWWEKNKLDWAAGKAFEGMAEILKTGTDKGGK